MFFLKNLKKLYKKFGKKLKNFEKKFIKKLLNGSKLFLSLFKFLKSSNDKIY